MSRVSTQTQAGAVDQSPELEDLKKRSQFWDIGVGFAGISWLCWG